MQIQFSDTIPTDIRVIGQVVSKDAMPKGLEAAVTEGAEAARFKGRVGQLFEAFTTRDGRLVRVVLSGAGDAKGDDRMAALEKAGATLAAKYLTSGEAALAVDFAGSGLNGEQAAAVLLGLRLRSWRESLALP